MKVLVIHPKDVTTDFLSNSYNSDFTVIRTEISDTILKKLIRSHDIIIMMGHGTQDGLIGFGRTYIGSDFVDDLRKKFCICIWCYASDFAQKYKLRTLFSTGMFISEMEEAYLEGLRNISNFDLSSSNYEFANALSRSFEDLSQNVFNTILGYYQFDSSQVRKYNIDLFYTNQ